MCHVRGLNNKHESSSIHMKNLQYLATDNIFSRNETYNLRSGNHLVRKNVRTKQYGIESISNLGAKLWDLYQVK